MWKGKTGTLIAKPIKIRTQITLIALIPHHKSPFSASGATCVSSIILNVFPQEKYNPSTPISINTEPNKVYKKNLIAAYSRCGPPHIPIKKYIGNNITSQKM